MSQLPAKIDRTWIVDTTGAVVVRAAAPPAPMASGQRHRAYRLGLLAVDQFMQEKGFTSNTDQSTTKFSWEKNSVYIDVSLVEPGRMAYVTSHVGYEYSSKKVNASVTTLRDVMGSDLVVRVMVCSMSEGGTAQPVYVPLPKDVEDPARHVLKNVLFTLATACDRFPKVKDAFTKQAIESAGIENVDAAILLNASV